MKILYVAKHNQTNSNDDEGAIAWALEALGHQVQCVNEMVVRRDVKHYSGDLLLFHKWDDPELLQRFRGRMPSVFWYFDLVEYPDSTLELRNETRRDWMRRILPHVELGFCTDGDWVSRTNADGSGKLVWLMQGADERVAVPLENHDPTCDILFTGISRRGGTGREDFVSKMQARYKDRFCHVVQGRHGRELAKLIARAKVVVAPNSPVTNMYWSNRVYLTQGFRACMLHPRCDRLMDHYIEDEEIVYYDDMDSLYKKIDMLLSNASMAATRKRIAQAGYTRTMREHTYRHRVIKLLDTLKERGITS